jgi:hypothetical protein
MKNLKICQKPKWMNNHNWLRTATHDILQPLKIVAPWLKFPRASSLFLQIQFNPLITSLPIPNLSHMSHMNLHSVRLVHAGGDRFAMIEWWIFHTRRDRNPITLDQSHAGDLRYLKLHRTRCGLIHILRRVSPTLLKVEPGGNLTLGFEAKVVRALFNRRAAESISA